MKSVAIIFETNTKRSAPCRFYFNHRVGTCVGLDLDGVRLASLEEALSHAYLLVLKMGQQAFRHASLSAIEVRNEAGALLFELPFSAVVKTHAAA